jgi:hypothetical protein
MEFIVSDFISLKLENGKTSLYVNEKLFKLKKKKKKIFYFKPSENRFKLN